MNPAPMSRFTPKLGLLALLFVTACGSNGTDWDLRSDSGFNTRASAPAPTGDANGLINYSGYQAVTAQNGETVSSIATRLGLNADELGRFNAIGVNDPLRSGEILVLPNKVAAQPNLDVTALASSALDRVETSTLAPVAPLSAPPPVSAPLAAEPVRHRVQRGETAFGIARQYDVSAKSLADWNGLGPDLGVREGQFLIIPTPGVTPPTIEVSAPGTGTLTPVPPSAKEPLPADTAKPAPAPTADLSKVVTAASEATFAMPVAGKIIRPYAKGKNDGIDIAANAGTAVKAAGAGTVAAVTKDTKGTPIVVIRHQDGLLTVYAGVDGLSVAKGDTVTRGQNIAVVRAGDPAFLHFEVRKGVESTDPMGYLQ